MPQEKWLCSFHHTVQICHAMRTTVCPNKKLDEGKWNSCMGSVKSLKRICCLIILSWDFCSLLNHIITILWQKSLATWKVGYVYSRESGHKKWIHHQRKFDSNSEIDFNVVFGLDSFKFFFGTTTLDSWKDCQIKRQHVVNTYKCISFVKGKQILTGFTMLPCLNVVFKKCSVLYILHLGQDGVLR